MYGVMHMYELLKLTWGRDVRVGYSREVAMYFGGSHFGGSAHGRKQKTKLRMGTRPTIGLGNGRREPPKAMYANKIHGHKCVEGRGGYVTM